MSSQERVAVPSEVGFASGVAGVTLAATMLVDLAWALELLSASQSALAGILPHGLRFTIVLVAFLAFVAWVYTRYSSLPYIDAVPEGSAVGAVVWFFVPVANLYFPYRTLAEIWDGTAPLDSHRPSRGPVVVLWVTLLMVAGLDVTSWLMRDALDGMFRSYFSGLSHLVRIVASILAIRMIAAVENRWKVRYAAILERYRNAPPEPEDAAPADESFEDFVPAPPVAPSPTASISGPAVLSPATAPRPAPISAFGVTSPENVSPAVATSAPKVLPPAANAQTITPTGTPVTAPLSPAAMNALTRLRGAATGAAVLAALTGVYAVMIVIMGLVQVSTSLTMGPFEAALMQSIAMLYIALALFALIPAIHLWRFHGAAKTFAKVPDENNLRTTLRFLGRYWAFIGGAAALVLGLEVVLIGIAILIPASMGLFR